MVHQTADGAESATAEPEAAAAPPPAKKKKPTIASFLSKASKSKERQVPATQTSPREKAQKEITSYLAVDNLPFFDDEDNENNPLHWWKTHCQDYPFLSKMARKYLCIQASSSPSERLFSKAGQVITPQRAQLKPQKANMLIFLADNLP